MLTLVYDPCIHWSVSAIRSQPGIVKLSWGAVQNFTRDRDKSTFDGDLVLIHILQNSLVGCSAIVHPSRG